MAQTAQAGMAYVSVDGKSMRLAGEASYRLSGEKREALIGMDGVHGYKSTPQEGMIKVTLRDARDVDLSALVNATDVTVTVELINGKTILGRNMWRNGELPEADVAEAQVPIEFAGLDVTEQ